MATRKPLVRISGKSSQLPAGDIVDAPGMRFAEGTTAPTVKDYGDRWLDTTSGIEYTWISPGTWVDLATAGIDFSTIVQTTGNQTIGGVKTFTSSPVVPGLNGGQLAGHRNVIINGAMSVSQRGTSFVAAVNAAYTLDRWTHNITGGGIATVSQQNSTAQVATGFTHSLRSAVTTADATISAGDYAFIEQKIEGLNVESMIGKSFTLSFWVRSSKTGVHCIALRNGGPDRSYVVEYTINTANTYEFKTITVTDGLITSGTWNWTTGSGLQVAFVIACGSTFHTTAGAWQTGNFIATSSQVNGLDAVGNIFEITGIQLESGTVATPFERRLDELTLCQYYFFKVSAASATGTYYSFAIGEVNTSTTVVCQFIFPRQMRVSPSMSGSGLDVSAGGALRTPTVFTYDFTSVNGSRLNFQGMSGMTVGWACRVIAANNNTAYIQGSAEL